MKFYQHILALVFAVKEINENPSILPNLTLGFHIYDNHHDERFTYQTTLELLFKSRHFVPNYKCDLQKNLIAVIGSIQRESSLYMANLLDLFKIPQLTYGSFASEDSDGKEFYFYRMVPNEARQYPGILQLLLHFGWTWVGLWAMDDDSGEHFLQTLELLLSRKGICLAFSKKMATKADMNDIADIVALITKRDIYLPDRKISTIILYGDTRTVMILNTYFFFQTFQYNYTCGKVWILTAQIDFALTALQRSFDFHFFHGAISFTIHSHELPGFRTFLQDHKPSGAEENHFLKFFWEQAFVCTFVNREESPEIDGSCTGEEKLESLHREVFDMDMSGHSYSIYNAVYAVAHALHRAHSSRFNLRTRKSGERSDFQELQPWQLHQFLQGNAFNNSAEEKVSFNSHREVEKGFDLMNMVTFPNKSSIPPLSECNAHCQAGSQKKKIESKKFCCYDCSQCPKGKVSSQKDMDDCVKCPEDDYPSNNQDRCLPKMLHFLSYEEPLGFTLTSIAMSFFLITALVLAIFLKHKDTPIVKANNREITYALLVSLLLCFLCSMLFLGQPSKVTCLLQQSAFGIIFTVAVSCVLAKTITVIVAFMATKPGSSMRKWVGKRMANAIVLSGSFVQAGICLVWLGTSPPFPNYDTDSMDEEIIFECNEGSVLMFDIVLGYMGLLSLISLTAAFFARKLPDSFNEAKFITFSMLIFCSVWVSFFPTYLSTKGKYMVAVEIFSIMTSSAGLLVCIFSPKCYIILLKPELNNRELLIRRKK
ncbi:vomeronasal type-2 receptor 26-like [Heteronotia binoei]|uniref:vomeronasal type-2 receptor 26-like n=1 Tax=Heteronotia binoei TaxID=13085 RepID=UPI00292EE0FE|nr:vomeronasal type-2 receptor 26-like [Heteronotia binoei]